MMSKGYVPFIYIEKLLIKTCNIMKSLFLKSIVLVLFLAVAVLANAQIKYYLNVN